MADIKENQMPSGIPQRLRGIDVNGNGIASTMQEVADALPEVTALNKGLLEKEKCGFVGYGATCNAGAGIGRSDAFALLTTNIEKIDTQFCFEIIDCNNYTLDKPVYILLKGYNPNNTTILQYFYYFSDKNFSNIVGGYINGKLCFLIPGFSLYDSIMIRSIDRYKSLDISISFTTEEPVWESRYIAT